VYNETNEVQTCMHWTSVNRKWNYTHIVTTESFTYDEQNANNNNNNNNNNLFLGVLESKGILFSAILESKILCWVVTVNEQLDFML
jgi:hypothetical protein